VEDVFLSYKLSHSFFDYRTHNR